MPVAGTTRCHAWRCGAWASASWPPSAPTWRTARATARLALWSAPGQPWPWPAPLSFLLRSPACCATLHHTRCGELLQHVSVGVVLVVAAALTPVFPGHAAPCNTCGATARVGPLADLLEPSGR